MKTIRFQIDSAFLIKDNGVIKHLEADKFKV